MASPAAPRQLGPDFDTGRYDQEAKQVYYAYHNAQTEDERRELFSDYIAASDYLQRTEDARLAQGRQLASRRLENWSAEADALAAPDTSRLNWLDVPFFKRAKTDDEVLQDQRRDYVLSRLKEAYPSAAERRDLLLGGYATAVDNYDPEYANKRYVGPFLSMENPIGAAISWSGAIPGTMISMSREMANVADKWNPVKPYPDAGDDLLYNLNTLTLGATVPASRKGDGTPVSRSLWSGYEDRTASRELPWQSQLSLDPKVRDEAMGTMHFMEYNNNTPSFTDHYESIGMPRQAAAVAGMASDALVDPMPGWVGALRAAKAGNAKGAMKMLRSEAYLPGAILGVTEGPSVTKTAGEKARELIDRLGR